MFPFPCRNRSRGPPKHQFLKKSLFPVLTEIVPVLTLISRFHLKDSRGKVCFPVDFRFCAASSHEISISHITSKLKPIKKTKPLGFPRVSHCQKGTAHMYVRIHVLVDERDDIGPPSSRRSALPGNMQISSCFRGGGRCFCG